MTPLCSASRLICCFLLVGLAWPAQLCGQPARPTTPAAAPAGPTKITQWAILSDLHMQTTGLPELLVAQLTQLGMQMVERDELAKIADEQSIALLAGGNVAERLKIGQLLHADALIVLRYVPNSDDPNQHRFSTVLCECRQGARLGSFSHPATRSEKVMADISRAIVDRATQFADGLQRLVAVAPFACLNMEHDYDTQAQAFFDILANHLLTLDGVSVLEVEEARQLAKEMTGGTDAAKRQVPLFVLPKFKVAFRDSAKFDLYIDIESGTEVHKLSVTDQTLNEALKWLHEQVIEQVRSDLSQTRGNLPLPVQQQRLAERADLFERLGNLSRAIECREAFLLAESHNVFQRRAILRHLNVQEMVLPMPDRLKSEKERQAIFAYMMSRERGLEHLSFLIHANLISRQQALQELKTLRPIAMGRLYYDGFMYAQADETTKAYWDASMAADRHFILGTARKILELKDQSPLSDLERANQDMLWYTLIMNLVSHDMGVRAGNENSFRYFMRVVSEVVPESLPPSNAAMVCLQRNWQQYVFPDQNGLYPLPGLPRQLNGPNPETVADYIRRLKQAPHKHLRLYGLLKAAPSQISPGLAIDPTSAPSELDSLLKELQAESRHASLDGVPVGALDLKRMIESRQTRNAPPPTPAAPKTATKSPTPPQTYIQQDWMQGKIDRLRIERLKDKVDTINRPLPIILNAQTELRFSQQSMDLLRAGTKPTSIAKASEATTVCWDGEHLWYSGPEKNVTLLDVSGKVVHSISRQHSLPPHDVDIRLFKLETNRILAYGKHGKEQGVWLALLSIQDGQPQVEVLHEARRRTGNLTIDNETMQQIQYDTSITFNPNWICPIHDQTRDLVYLGRHGFQPLKIDLRSREITVTSEFGTRFYDGQTLVRLPHVFKAHHHGVAHLQLSVEDNGLRMINENLIWAGSPPKWYDQYPTILEQGDWIVKPGVVWYRFRKDGTQVEQLVREPLRGEFHHLRYWLADTAGQIRSDNFKYTIEEAAAGP